MLDLLAFDLDGTLVDSETLKAQSYGWAAHRLKPDVDPEAVEAAYPPYVGRSREEIAHGLLDEFGLADAARQRDGSVEPWQSFVALRLERYRALLSDGDLVRSRARTGAEMVRQAHRWARAVALVTTSGRQNAGLVLDALELEDAFDAVVTADDVEQTKPDPEAYRLALTRTGAAAERSLAIEDSATGARGALAAGVPVLAVPDALTRRGVLELVESGALPEAFVIEPGALEAAIERRAG